MYLNASFQAENLARVHHKNLVTLMGYCIDKSCMSLVYEYMQEGNLQEKLKGDYTRLVLRLFSNSIQVYELSPSEES